MKTIALLISVIFIGATSFAGFLGYQSTTNLGNFSAIKCSTGLTCTKVGDKLNMVSSQTLSAPLTLTAANNADSYLLLQADNSDDNGDDWKIAALASGNSLSFLNDTSGSQVSKFSLSTAGVITLADSETITDASDVVSIGFDDAAAELRLVGFEGTNSSLTLQADESDDNGDDWKLTSVASDNSFTISNDTSGSQVAKLTIDTTGNITGPGTGSISGYLKKSVAATATTLTASQCGSTVRNTGAVVINLPNGSAGIIGCRFTFVTGNASNYDINPGGSDQILVLTNAAGDAIRNATLGNSVVLEYTGTNEWTEIAAVGTWTDIN